MCAGGNALWWHGVVSATAMSRLLAQGYMGAIGRELKLDHSTVVWGLAREGAGGGVGE
jgi:hypothetical protein